MKKPAVKKPAVVKKTVAEYVDETLDDPVAEKARRQKLVEQADLEAAKELFGTDGAEVDLATYNPKSEKEFTKFGRLVATKFLTPVNQSAFYKEAVKSFNTYAIKHMTAAEVKEIEATLVAVRNEKVKAEKAESLAAAKAATPPPEEREGQEEVLEPGHQGRGLWSGRLQVRDVRRGGRTGFHVRGIGSVFRSSGVFRSERDAFARADRGVFPCYAPNERTNHTNHRSTANHREPPLCTAYVR